MRIEGYVINDPLNPHECEFSKNANGEIVISKISGITENKVDFVVSANNFEANKKKAVFYNNVDEWIVIDDEEMNRSRDLASFLEYQKMVRPVRAVFNIIYADNMDNSMVFFVQQARTELPENEWVSHNKGFWLHDYLAEQYPNNQAYLRNNVKAKHDLLAKTNPIDSVTAVEQQLDLLTEIVKSLVNNEEQPSWSSSFLNDTLAQSSQTGRPVSSIKDDIVSFKTKLRTKVAEYLNKKS